MSTRWGIGLLITAATMSPVAAWANGYAWQAYDGHQYALTNAYGNWTMAESEAIAAGGHLVTVNSQAENDWLTTNFEGYSQGYQGIPSGSLLWIGLYDDAGTWKWANGEPVTYMAPWYSGSPSEGIHAYLHPHPNPFAGRWWNFALHDGSDPDHWPKGIIEVVPEPATLVLLALGGPGLILRKRSACEKRSPQC